MLSVGIYEAILSPAPNPFCIVKIIESLDTILLNFEATGPTPAALVAIIKSSHSFASFMSFDAFTFFTVLSPLKPDTRRPLLLIAFI